MNCYSIDGNILKYYNNLCKKKYIFKLNVKVLIKKIF